MKWPRLLNRFLDQNAPTQRHDRTKAHKGQLRNAVARRRAKSRMVKDSRRVNR